MAGLGSRTVALSCTHLDGAAGCALLRTTEDAFRGGLPVVVIDFARVRTIDSQGLAALLALRRGMPESARAVLAGLSARALVSAASACLHEVFEIYPRAETAVAALGG